MGSEIKRILITKVAKMKKLNKDINIIHNMNNNEIEKSKITGKYVGPVLAILLISEIINFKIWEIAANPQLVYLNGFILLLFGFYIIRIHNIWIKSWQVLITLSGWFFTTLGLLRMFFPQAKQANQSIATHIGLIVLLTIELIIIFKSYSKKR